MLSGIILGSHSWCVFWVRKSSSNWSFYRQASALKSNLLVYLVTDIFILVFHKKNVSNILLIAVTTEKKSIMFYDLFCVCGNIATHSYARADTFLNSVTLWFILNADIKFTD